MFQVVPINMVQDVIMYDMSTRHIRYRELQFGCVRARACVSSMAESMAGPSKKAKFKIYRQSESLFDHFSRLGTSQSASVSIVSNESSVSAVSV